MKKPVTYILSLLISALMVFVIIGLSGSLVVFIRVTPDKALSMAEEKELQPVVKKELFSYFEERYNTTSIPADVYTSAISDELIRETINSNIKSGFEFLSSGKTSDAELSVPELDKNLEDFYNNYAEENGIEKNSKFSSSLEKAQTSAKNAIADKCDVFKMRALQKHGVLQKLAPVYRNLGKLIAIVIACEILLMLLLILVCRKEKKTVLYWMGVSALIAGAVGTVPSAILLATDYFSSFSIKQASVFSAYTSAMHSLTSAFMAVSIAVAAVGIALLIVYGVICSKGKAVNPTDV